MSNQYSNESLRADEEFVESVAVPVESQVEVMIREAKEWAMNGGESNLWF